MRVRIKIPWNISEKVKEPLRDVDGKHIVVTDPFTLEAKPQWVYRDYKEGDIIDLSNAEAVLKQGLAVRVDENDVEIVTVQPFKTGETGETRSGRVFYNRFVEKYDKDPLRVKEALELEQKLVLDKVAQYALLKTANNLDGSMRRQYFLDHSTQSFITGFWETMRIEIEGLIDDRISEIERTVPRNLE